MRIPSAITGAKVVVLTGAGASMPLGRFTTRAFLDDFRQVDYPQLAVDAETKKVLDWVLQEAANNNLDIEDVLDRLERRQGALDLLKLDGFFQKEVLRADRRTLALQYGSILRRLSG